MAKAESEGIKMKNLFAAAVAFALIVMPYTYYYIPALNQSNSMRQEIANLKTSLSRFSGNNFEIYKELYKSKETNYEEEKERLNLLFPEFSTAKNNLMAPFDIMRNEIPGDWHVVPEGKFQNIKSLVYWSFKFKYIGTCADALKVLAYMESAPQFMRIQDYSIETLDSSVTLSGNVQLIFRDKSIDNDGGKK